MPKSGDPAADPFKVGGLVLAAGGASRMGSPKQLLEIGGRSLIDLTLDAVLGAAIRPVVVVLGAHAGIIRSRMAGREVKLVVNENWPTGMASSLRLGLEALLSDTPELKAILITPCDLPNLSAQCLLQLVNRHRSTGLIAAAHYRERVGSPAVFGTQWFKALSSLKGDEGARRILNSEAQSVTSVDLPSLAFDIDTPGDWDAWKASQGAALETPLD